jgi:hypothetical protein
MAITLWLAVGLLQWLHVLEGRSLAFQYLSCAANIHSFRSYYLAPTLYKGEISTRVESTLLSRSDLLCFPGIGIFLIRHRVTHEMRGRLVSIIIEDFYDDPETRDELDFALRDGWISSPRCASGHYPTRACNPTRGGPFFSQAQAMQCHLPVFRQEDAIIRLRVTNGLPRMIHHISIRFHPGSRGQRRFSGYW